MKIVQVLIKKKVPIVNSEVLLNLKNIESPAKGRSFLKCITYWNFTYKYSSPSLGHPSAV